MAQEPLPPTVSEAAPDSGATSALRDLERPSGQQVHDEEAPERPAWQVDLLRAALVLAVLALLILFGWWLAGASKLMGDPRQCWENREVDGRLYKMNPCTGQWRLIGDTQPQAGDQ